MNNKKAFTLAEVLITLSIIGVIAAVTVPSLLKKTDESELVSGCLKAYSTLSNAVQRMTIDYGKIGRGKDWTDADTFTKNIMKYMNVVKKCSEANKNDCFLPTSKAKSLAGGTPDYAVTANSFVTADGMFFTYQIPTSNYYGISATDYKNIIGRFVVDINGKDKPNIVGLDIYYFVLIKEKGILPAGASSVADCKDSDQGRSCATYVITNRKIDYIK